MQATSLPVSKNASRRPALCWSAAFAIVILILWFFPRVWYTRTGDAGEFVWLVENSEASGWDFKNIPVGQAAESVLVADRILNGEFRATLSPVVVRVFSAKRYLNKENEIGLFSHTPDRCWTDAGWEIQPIAPEEIECSIQGLKVRFERRLFVHEAQKELVYFGALVGGKPLPYRLDQYLAAGLKRSSFAGGDAKGGWSRVKSTRVWGWMLDCFTQRTPLCGPQHFIRISTPATNENLAAADDVLRNFLTQWLSKTDYADEFARWRAQEEKAKAKS